MTRTACGAGPALRARFRLLVLAPSLGLLLAEATPATVIYRCGPDGRELSDLPCADGTRLTARPSPPMLAEGEGRRVAAQQARWAEQLRRERLAREAMTAPGSGGIAPRAAPAASQPSSGARRPTAKKGDRTPMAEGVLTPPLRAEPGSGGR